MWRALAALVCVATSARAAEVWSWPVTAEAKELVVVVEARGFYKPALTVVTLPRGLLDATDALATAADEARAELPPAAAAAFPASVALPERVALSTHTLRVWGTARAFDTVDFNAAWQLAGIAASSPLFVPGGPGALGNRLVFPARRLIDFDPFLLSSDGLALQHNLDQLNVAVRTPVAHVVIGRQVISWGTGRIWNPTDLFSPFAPTDIDREVRRGADAARVSLPLGDVSELDLLWLPQRYGPDTGAVLRARTNLFDVDGSITLAKFARDLLLGADVAGDAGPLGLHAEAALTLPIERALTSGRFDDVDTGDAFLRAVAGATARPHEQWTLVLEGYFNGYGADEPSGYVERMRSDRVIRGEMFGAGRAYLGLISAWSVTDLLSVVATCIVNVRDPSALTVLSFEHALDQHVILRGGINLPFGGGPDARVFEQLDGEDVLTRSDALTDAATTLGARSEFGLSAPSLFLQLAAYFG